MDEPPAASLFAPPRALQGSTIPIQLRWPPEAGKGPVTFAFSRAFELLEAHNAELALHEPGSSTIVVTAEEPGYVGLSIRTDRSADSSAADLSISIRAELATGEFIDQRQVRLFRPNVSARGVRPIATVEGEPNKPIVKAPVDLVNAGEGTAILLLNVDRLDTGESALAQPAESARQAFLLDLSARLPGLAEALPKHGDLMRQFVWFLENPPDLENPRVVDDLDVFLEKFNTAIMTDNELNDSLQQVIAWAFARNFTLAELVVEFVNYLLATGDQGVILGNALDRLPLPQGSSRFRLSIDVLDLNKADYPRIELGEVEFTTDAACEVPAHQLLRYVPAVNRTGGIRID